LPSLARACDRVGVSDRAAAAIVSAVLQDFGLISTEDLQNVVDKNMFHSAQIKSIYMRCVKLSLVAVAQDTYQGDSREHFHMLDG